MSKTQGILEWFFDPLVQIIDYCKEPPQIEEDILPDLHPTQPHQIFRPKNFEEYIGQERAKTILRNYIQAMKDRNQTMPHILISGSAGTGKTTLAQIIAKELNVKFKEVITATLETPAELLMNIHEVDGGVLFLDECHGLCRPMAESIYSIMEDFTWNGVPIKPFTLIGATTELGELLVDRAPFVDRFKIPIELEDYTLPELSVMSRQYRLTVFPYDVVDFHLHDTLAENCRYTPRIVIRLTEALVYFQDIQKVLDCYNIIKDGYTKKDLKILKYLNLNEKGIGLQGLASYLGTSSANYTHQIEPYLLKNELLIRTPRGRRLTTKGKEKIKELDNVLLY